MTSMIKPEVKPGLRSVPLQRSAAKSESVVELATVTPIPAPLVSTDPDRLSAKDLFCLGFAFSAALLLIGGGAAASIDDNVPPTAQTGVTGR